MTSKIWQRMILWRTLKFVLFFLISLYIVYVVIDLSAHSGRLFSSCSSLLSILIYYLHHLIARLDLFLPLSLLLATISLLSSMNLHHEIVSLRMAGISLFQLLRPLFLLSLGFSLLSYLNFEYSAPTSLHFIENFKENYLRHRNKKMASVKMALLNDGTKIVYQSYDAKNKEFFDLFWIRSHTDIWHIKYFSLVTKKGTYVDHLVRKEKKSPFVKLESFEERLFSEISLIPNDHAIFFLPKEHLSLSHLLWQKTFLSQSDRASSLSHLHYKLAMPLLSPLIILSIAPFCLCFSRNLQIFLLTALSLFGFFVFITLMDACVILGENQVMSPFFALWMPMILLFAFFGWRLLTTKQ